jgi:DNA-binding transcriptional LysR family regulator
MQIEGLREYILLSQTMNITKAAQKLHISQSALSNHIIKMERKLGLILLDRSSTKIRFTVAGYQFLESASRIVNIYDDFLAEHHNGKQAKSDHFVIQTLQHADRATSVILLRIMEFKELYPEAQIEVAESLAFDTMDNMRKGIVDCGYLGIRLHDPQHEEGVIAIPMLEEELIVWLDKESPLYSAERLEPRDLEACNIPIWVGLGSNELENIYREIFEKYHVKAKYNPRYCISGDDYFLNKIHSDDAVMLIKGSEVIHSINVRTDRSLRTFNPPIYVKTYAAFRESSGNDTLSQFGDFLLKKYKEDPRAEKAPNMKSVKTSLS